MSIGHVHNNYRGVSRYPGEMSIEIEDVAGEYG